MDLGYKCRFKLPLIISVGFALSHLFSYYVPRVEIIVEDEEVDDDDLDPDVDVEEYEVADDDDEEEIQVQVGVEFRLR